MMGYEERIKSLQWKWTSAHATIKRYEELLREYRLTALGVFIIMMASSLFLPQKTETSNVMFVFTSVFWACIYVVTLGPHIITKISGKFRYEEHFEIHEDGLEEFALELERITYVQRKYYRFVRMSTLLLIYGILTTALGFSFVLFR